MTSRSAERLNGANPAAESPRPFWALGEAFAPMTREAKGRFLALLAGGWVVGNAISTGILISELKRQHLTPPPGSSPLSVMALQRPMAAYLGVNLCAAMLLAGFFAAVRFAQRRPVGSYLTAAAAFRWRRLWGGFALSFGGLSLLALIQAALQPAELAWTAAPGEVLAILPWVLLLTPAQCLMEEVLFRGWLLQEVAGKKGRVGLSLAVVSGTFALPHLLNPEALQGGQLPWAAAYYLGIGAGLTALALRENGLELTWGLHLGINLVGALVVSGPHGTLRLPTLLVARAQDLRVDVAVGAALLALAWGLSQRVWPPAAVEGGRRLEGAPSAITAGAALEQPVAG